MFGSQRQQQFGEETSLVQPVCLFAEESSMQIGLGRKCTWAGRLLPFSMSKLSLLAQGVEQKSLFQMLSVSFTVLVL